MNLGKCNSIRVVLFSICSCIVAGVMARADEASDDKACTDAESKAQQKCASAQAATDFAAITAEQATVANDLTDYLAAVANDAADQAKTAAGCDATLWGLIGNPALNPVPGDVGSCGRTKNTSDDAAHAVYNIAFANCAMDKDPEACRCPLSAQLNFTLAQDKATETKCRSDAQATHDDACIPNSKAVQSQADGNASADQTQKDRNAAAGRTKTTTASQYTADVCNNDAVTVYSNCMLDAAIKALQAAPPVDTAQICRYGCAKTYNTSVAAAYSALLNAIGPADAQHQSDRITYDATQTHDDAVANNLYTFTTASDKNAKVTAEAIAGNVRDQSKSGNLNQYNLDVANCECKYKTDPTMQQSCKVAAKTKQVNNDVVADGVYNAAAAEPPTSPVGAAYTTCFNADQLALAALNTTITKDKTTHDDNVAKSDTTWNNIFNTRLAIYNVAIAKAQKAYDDCVKGCNQG